MDGRTQEAGLGATGEVLAPRGVSRGSRTLRKPRIQERPLSLWTLLSSGFWSGEWPQDPGITRGARVFSAQSASEVRSGRGCSRTQRFSASPPRNCQRSPGSDTSSASQPVAVPGGGRGHKSPGPRPIRCLFPGKAWRHRPQESRAQPIDNRKRPGTLGAVVSPGRMLQTFARRFSQIVGNTRRE